MEIKKFLLDFYRKEYILQGISIIEEVIDLLLFWGYTKMVEYGRITGKTPTGIWVIKDETTKQEIILYYSCRMNFSEGQRIWYAPDGLGSFWQFGAEGLEKRIQGALANVDTSNVFAVNIFDPMDTKCYCYIHKFIPIATVARTKEALEQARIKAADLKSGVVYFPHRDHCYENKWGGIAYFHTLEFVLKNIPELKKEGMLFIPVNWLISVEKRMELTRPTPHAEKVPIYVYTIQEKDLELCVKYTKFP